MRQYIRLPFSIAVVSTAAALVWITMAFAQVTPDKNPVDKTAAPGPTANEAAPLPVPKPNPVGLPSTRPTLAVPSNPAFQVRTISGPEGPMSVYEFASQNVIPGYPQSQEERDLEIKTHDLVVRYKEMKNEVERKALFDDLSEVVTKQFNLRQKSRNDELKQLEEQLKKLQAIQEKRESARAEIIGERVNQLLLESEGLSWGAAPVVPQPPRGVNLVAPQPGAGVRLVSPANPFVHNSSLPPTTTPQKAGELKIFKVRGVDDANQFLETIEALIGNGPQRPDVVLTVFGSKIVARGSSEGLKLVADLIHELQEDTDETVREKAGRPTRK